MSETETIVRTTVNKGGRPYKVIDYDLLETFASLQCTDGEIATGLGISPDTMTKRKQDDDRFLHAYMRGREKGKTTLRRLQWKRASAGSDTMLVWLGKQYLGQTDRQEHTGADGQQLFPAVTVLFGREPEPLVETNAPVTISFDGDATATD